MKVALLLCLLLPVACWADAVFVSAAPDGTVPSYPSQYSLKAVPADTDIVSVCDSASIPVSRGDMANCSSARRWVLRTAVKATDKVGYCYGASTTVLGCDIANGGGEGWQLASAIWTTPTPPGQPVFTGTATLTCTAPTQNTDGSVLTNLTGYQFVYGSANPPSMPLAVTTACSYVANGLTVGTWYFAVQAFNADGVYSALSTVVSKTITAPATCTAPQPADKTNACPAGTTGSWKQTYVAAPYPTCWAAMPTGAPAGACVATAPPILKTAETIGYALYAGNYNKDTFQRVGTFASPVQCTVAVFKDLDGVSRNIITSRDNLVLDAGATRPKQVWAKCALQ